MIAFFKKHSLILLLLMATGFSHAQIIPGYLGKRNIFKYDMGLSPALNGYTYLNKYSPTYSESASDKAEESLFFPFNCTHNINYERVMGRKFSLTLNYSFAASKDYFSFEQDETDLNSGQIETFYYKEAPVNYYGHYGTLALTFYGKKALAPFGHFFKLNVLYGSMYAQFVENEVTSTNTTTLGEYVVLNTEKRNYGITTMGLGCSFGMNRIINDKFVISRGINLTLFQSPDVSYYENFNIQELLYKRMRRRDWFTFYVGFGYLL